VGTIVLEEIAVSIFKVEQKIEHEKNWYICEERDSWIGALSELVGEGEH
jgi:hypothetical protein